MIVDLDRLSAADLAHLAALARDRTRPHVVDPGAAADDIAGRLARGEASPRTVGWWRRWLPERGEPPAPPTPTRGLLITVAFQMITEARLPEAVVAEQATSMAVARGMGRHDALPAVAEGLRRSRLAKKGTVRAAA